MTDRHESHDTFTAVSSLINLISDPAACAKRLQELRRLDADIAKAQSKLAQDITAHDQAVVAAKAELAEREAALWSRAAKLAADEGMLRETQKLYAERMPERFPSDPNLFGTITREPEYGH